MLKKIFITLCVITAIVIVGGNFYLKPASQDSEYVISSGTILTMDENTPKASAIWVKDGIIKALGQNAIKAAQANSLPIIDLKGQTLTPGLVEPHTHPTAAALLGATVDVSAITHSNRQQIMDTLIKASDGIALTPWMIAFGWDPVAIPDLEPPTLEELDAILPDRPMVILTQMMHEAYLNTAAFKAAGVKIIDKEDRFEGFVRDENGKLTGTVREVHGISEIVSKAPSASPAVAELLLRLQYNKYARAGYTTIGVTGAVGRLPDPVGLLKKVSKEDTSPLRTFVYLLPDQTEKYGLEGDDNFKIVGIKFWLDGSPFTGGAAFKDGYHESELTEKLTGIPHTHPSTMNYDDSIIRIQAGKYHAKGYQIALHVQGEDAIDQALMVFGEIQAEDLKPGLHHRLEHNALMTREEMRRAKELELSTGFFVDHIYYYGDALPHLVGPERANRYMPVKSALDMGLVTSLHGDHPATPVDAIRVMRTATQRKSRSGKNITAPSEAITPEQALYAMTMGGASQLGMQDKIGSIAVGKKADFTLFDKSPIEALQKGEEFNVVKTWKGGLVTDIRPATFTHLSLIWQALLEIINKPS
ncbi:amidohydrolase family protein [Sneathiella sp. P13V-1]|uniref:amidohydrolase n=1 Tax=Sneathiella sp. P13V-1 TaxID=2697366 RepID=UPI00187B12DA|nr:amidohydrolase [Sneathiella sp. P13V-1]MBE7635234.1 amidohydrolase family protein [Sneathiella sp. P13V-1]